MPRPPLPPRALSRSWSRGGDQECAAQDLSCAQASDDRRHVPGTSGAQCGPRCPPPTAPSASVFSPALRRPPSGRRRSLSECAAEISCPQSLQPAAGRRACPRTVLFALLHPVPTSRSRFSSSPLHHHAPPSAQAAPWTAHLLSSSLSMAPMPVCRAAETVPLSACGTRPHTPSVPPCSLANARGPDLRLFRALPIPTGQLSRSHGRVAHVQREG